VLAFKPQVILGEAQAILEASKSGTGLVNHPVGMITARHCVEDRLLPRNLQLSFCDPPFRHSEGWFRAAHAIRRWASSAIARRSACRGAVGPTIIPAFAPGRAIAGTSSGTPSASAAGGAAEKSRAVRCAADRLKSVEMLARLGVKLIEVQTRAVAL
jgi:hypothetical protein